MTLLERIGRTTTALATLVFFPERKITEAAKKSLRKQLEKEHRFTNDEIDIIVTLYLDIGEDLAGLSMRSRVYGERESATAVKSLLQQGALRVTYNEFVLKDYSLQKRATIGEVLERCGRAASSAIWYELADGFLKPRSMNPAYQPLIKKLEAYIENPALSW
ncbi:MAG: hypothetical protein Q7R96_06695 [Nanoarchaeota archaeon]|nr:hypothetical protein [Nanoarchaeota archaeon]